MRLEEFRKEVKIKASVDKNRYVVMKAEEIPENLDKVFGVIKDKNEITVIARENNDLEAIEEEKCFRLITFDVKLPFELVGFMAYISKVLADKGISILAVSAYSTDHIFMREEDLEEAVTALKKRGILVNR